MNLVSLRVITDDVDRLVQFYEAVTGVQAIWSTSDFAELRTLSGTLAIAHTRTMPLFGAGKTDLVDHQRVIIEFLVTDVDQVYAERRGAIGEVVQAPTTQPWGNRSLLFRDPDGNLVNFFMPVSARAIEKFSAHPR